MLFRYFKKLAKDFRQVKDLFDGNQTQEQES